ncbi:protochlorophyllide oxidoreductase [Nostocaceae cyanobacterium CENA369]|uniref:Protochlorophyllide oxidoreductase n=1 Tax=Dendronalium phyllosphericum CENA369 TaxID=1725256 RepID=A0A8J7I9P9_9NOST|nr:protochlorophyllide oxidoreductase [Dendronalium phyllosphericum]MBH8575022.1 protochlorophyllide oxidoreductase [Dendronalium phyllosphericum CENA369]
MASNEVKAGSKVVMTHAQRQAFMKTSPLGQLFGVAHLLPQVEAVTNSNHAANQEKVADILVISEQVFQYEGRGKWSKRLSWKQVQSYCIEKSSSQRKVLATV